MRSRLLCDHGIIPSRLLYGTAVRLGNHFFLKSQIYLQLIDESSSRAAKGFWNDIEHQRQFLEKIAPKLGVSQVSFSQLQHEF